MPARRHHSSDLQGRQTSNVLWAMSKMHAARLLPPPSFRLTGPAGAGRGWGGEGEGEGEGEGAGKGPTVGSLMHQLAARLAEQWGSLRGQVGGRARVGVFATRGVAAAVLCMHVGGHGLERSTQSDVCVCACLCSVLWQAVHKWALA